MHSRYFFKCLLFHKNIKVDFVGSIESLQSCSRSLLLDCLCLCTQLKADTGLILSCMAGGRWHGAVEGGLGRMGCFMLN